MYIRKYILRYVMVHDSWPNIVLLHTIIFPPGIKIDMCIIGKKIAIQLRFWNKFLKNYFQMGETSIFQPGSKLKSLLLKWTFITINQVMKGIMQS